MVLQNNYIFLPEKKEEKQKEGVVLKTGFASNFEREFSNVQRDIEKSSPFKTYFKVDIENDGCLAYFVSYIVEENVFLNLFVEAQTEFKAIKILEDIQKQIYNSKMLNDNYTLIVSYDSISNYYCNKIYPKIHYTERLLRRLCFNIYILKFGREYYSKTIEKNIQEKAKKNIRNKKTQERLKYFFYSLDMGDIQTMLFSPHWTDEEENKRKEILSNKDLTALTDDELRKAFENCRPMSDWERLFSDKMQDIDTETLLDNIRKYRNIVAHSKLFSYQEYLSCRKMLNKLIKAIEEALKIMEEKDFIEKNWENLKKSIENISKSIAKIVNNIPVVLEGFLSNLNALRSKWDAAFFVDDESDEEEHTETTEEEEIDNEQEEVL